MSVWDRVRNLFQAARGAKALPRRAMRTLARAARAWVEADQKVRKIEEES